MRGLKIEYHNKFESVMERSFCKFIIDFREEVSTFDFPQRNGRIKKYGILMSIFFKKNIYYGTKFER